MSTVARWLAPVSPEFNLKQTRSKNTSLKFSQPTSEGLRDSGWCDDESEVRLTYLSQFVTYILFFPLITLVTNLREHRRKKFFRRRLGVDDRTVVDQVSQCLHALIRLVDEGLARAEEVVSLLR